MSQAKIGRRNHPRRILGQTLTKDHKRKFSLALNKKVFVYSFDLDL